MGGALFTWGGDFSWSRSQSWNDDHQGALGHGDLDGRLVPTQVLGEDDVRQVAAGRGFTIALNGLGQVLQMGATGAIKRRRGDARALWEGARTPVIVGGPLAAMRAEVITAGEGHVLAACTLSRGGGGGGAPGVAPAAASRLVAWGVNSQGQLGCSSPDDHAVPQVVVGLNGRRVLHLAAGGTFSVAIVERDPR
jgi:alpha-tubulin suppressor-like RCC1 family protein